MNYRIIGQDGKTYGPAPAEKVREWIAQGRADSRTPIFLEGAADWTFIGLLPEFASNFSSTPPVIAPPKRASGDNNGFATAGFICGLISCICCCGCPFNILGLVFSIVALIQINGQVEKQAGWGLALAGLICSASSLLVSFGLGFLQLATMPLHFPGQLGPI
jgi:hypothetical protein